MVNWTVRFRNPIFWAALIPAVLLLVQSVLAIFGIEWDYSEINLQLLAIIEAVFGVLTILGIVSDPTTEGVSDSSRALRYSEPAPNAIDTIKEDADGDFHE